MVLSLNSRKGHEDEILWSATLCLMANTYPRFEISQCFRLRIGQSGKRDSFILPSDCVGSQKIRNFSSPAESAYSDTTLAMH